MRISDAADPLLAGTLERARQDLGTLMNELDVAAGYAAAQQAARAAMQWAEVTPAELSLLSDLLAAFHPSLSQALDERRAGRHRALSPE